jgi:hypothetical protein
MRSFCSPRHVWASGRSAVVLPFTEHQFLDVFARYNAAIWPIQIGAYLFGIFVVWALWNRSIWATRLAFWAMAAMWAWTGLAYHLLFFSAINPAGWLFAALFVLQAALLFAASGKLRFGSSSVAGAAFGWVLIAYALVSYPALSLALGHAAEELPMFGVTPCPLVLFTCGVLLLGKPQRWLLWIVPLSWSLIGGTAAFLLGVEQDWPLLASGPAVILLAAYERFRQRHRLMRENGGGR